MLPHGASIISAFCGQPANGVPGVDGGCSGSVGGGGGGELCVTQVSVVPLNVNDAHCVYVTVLGG